MSHAQLVAPASTVRPPIISRALLLRFVSVVGSSIGRGHRRAVDSTILADAVATQDTITQLISQIRRVDRTVPGAGERIAAVCIGYD
jgi:hypothetical protein